MPRVHTRTRKRAEVKRPMMCAGPCKRDDREIKVGDSYYTWARKSAYGGTTYFKHAECGRPRPTQLSSRKTAQIDEAISDAEWPTPSFDQSDPAGSCSSFIEDVKATAMSIAEVAREVGQEYQESFDNMPEGLNQGETGQALEEVAQELESWADEIESWDPSSDEPDWPDTPEEDEDRADYVEACEQAFSTWADDVLDEAQSQSSEYPEYNG